MTEPESAAASSADASSSPPPAAPASGAGALARWGGLLVAPRHTLRALPAGRVGAWDGVWLTLAYVLGAQLSRLADGVAAVAAMGLINGGLVLLQAVGRSLLPPIMVLFLVETLLGSERAHRRGVFLAPLVFAVVAAKLAAQLGAPLSGPSFVPDLVGAVWSAALAVALRHEVAAERTVDADDTDDTDDTDDRGASEAEQSSEVRGS